MMPCSVRLTGRLPAAVGRCTSRRDSATSAEEPEVDAPTLLEHEEFAVGLNYWWSPSFVFKLSYHHVDGNRIAGPEADELAEVAEAGLLESRTDLVLFGVQFTF
jgi:hypothetical protein